MSRFMTLFGWAVILTTLDFIPFTTQAAEDIARGKYLVSVAGCNDCHTPGYFFGKPDESRYLGGSEVGFEIPGVGVFHGPNLTPGQGDWAW